MTNGIDDIPAPLSPLDPRETAGYRLLARLGEGGMGTVYLSHTRGGQPVAFKVIRQEYGQDPDFRRRFEQEVRAARRVQGYHLVPVVDHDTTGPLPWIASAFVPALTLADALTAYGPFPCPPSSSWSAARRGRSARSTRRKSSTATSSPPTSCSARPGRTSSTSASRGLPTPRS